jgi:hypothetical protein
MSCLMSARERRGASAPWTTTMVCRQIRQSASATAAVRGDIASAMFDLEAAGPSMACGEIVAAGS